MMGPTEEEERRREGTNPKGAAAQEARRSQREQEDSVSESEADEESKTSAGDGKAGGGAGEMTQHRREKRLAMNRESARARRKRKKMLLDTLEQQVAELAERNQRLQSTVESLQGKVRTLESELTSARSTIAMLNSQQPAAAASIASAAAVGMGSSRDAGGPESLYRLFPSAGSARLMPDSMQAQLLAEEALLRRNAALEFRAYAAGRESAALEAYRQQMTAANSPGIPVSAMQGTIALPSEMVGIDVGRVSEGFPSLAGTSSLFADARAPSASSPSQSQVISALLQQRAATKFQQQAGKP